MPSRNTTPLSPYPLSPWISSSSPQRFFRPLGTHRNRHFPPPISPSSLPRPLHPPPSPCSSHCPTPLTICSIYLPPCVPYTSQDLHSLLSQFPSPLLFVGDFNLRDPP